MRTTTMEAELESARLEKQVKDNAEWRRMMAGVLAKRVNKFPFLNRPHFFSF